MAISETADHSLTSQVALAATGDEAAFAQIARAHHDDMTRVSFMICRDLDMADEAVQAAWSIAWSKLATLNDPGRLRSWLVTVAANETRQLLRRRHRRTVVEVKVAAGGMLEGIDPAARPGDLDLVNALARLSADDRALLALRYVAGFDSREIGQAMGLSASGTRARLSRLLDRLRKELSDD